MNGKFVSVFVTLLLSMSFPVSAHVGLYADHSRVKNLFVHFMGLDHLAFLIGLGLCVYVLAQPLIFKLMRVKRKKQR